MATETTSKLLPGGPYLGRERPLRGARANWIGPVPVLSRRNSHFPVLTPLTASLVLPPIRSSLPLSFPSSLFHSEWHTSLLSSSRPHYLCRRFLNFQPPRSSCVVWRSKVFFQVSPASSVENVLHLIASVVGRPLSDIRLTIAIDGLDGLLKRV